jgi:hypothetical protein
MVEGFELLRVTRLVRMLAVAELRVWRALWLFDDG